MPNYVRIKPTDKKLSFLSHMKLNTDFWLALCSFLKLENFTVFEVYRTLHIASDFINRRKLKIHTLDDCRLNTRKTSVVSGIFAAEMQTYSQRLLSYFIID
jgi:hypothetical protein